MCMRAILRCRRATPARQRPVILARATRADNDEQLLSSWLDTLTSAHTRRNFETTTRRFLEGLPMGLRAATVEDGAVAP
jgi:hypothetical protein